MLAFMLCISFALTVQGYEAETLWMQVVCLSELLILGRHLFVKLGDEQLIDRLIDWLVEN